MFTISQIKEAHAKVKSGADFPKYVQDMIGLGVMSYDHYVSDGHIQYHGANDFTISADGKWAPRNIAVSGDAEKIKYSLSIHQKGQTDYPTFCKEAAEAGVEKWVVDMKNMICVYYDKKGHEMVVESIPILK